MSNFDRWVIILGTVIAAGQLMMDAAKFLIGG